MTLRRGARWVPAIVGLALAAGPLAGVVTAATTFGQPTAKSTYGSSIDFTQPATIVEAPRRVEVLVDLPGSAGPLAVEVAEAPTGPGAVTLRYSLGTGDGVLPNTTVTARWRLTGADGTVQVGPPVTIRYDDTRFTWRTRVGAIVRVHWYQGSDAFGQRALDIGERAVRETSQLLGVKETEPVDFFVYADQAAFYQALGPGTRENVGGQANADIRTLFALITPGEINADWVGIVIPHELTHLVFNTAVENPYHFPPRWLNEGLAVYLSQGYDVTDRALVASAAKDGSLMPLDGLAGEFPTTRDRFFLAYAESVSAVDYLVRTYGRDDLVALIKSYARGVTDGEAFTSALGVDAVGFDAAWRRDLNARDATVHGPRPAPPGPLPAGWTQSDGSAGLPLPSGAPGSSALPASSGNPSSPGPDGAGDRRGSTLPIILAAAGLLVAVAAVGYGLTRPRRRPPVAIPPSLPPGFDQPDGQGPERGP